MTGQINLEKFNAVYDKTYNNILKFIVCKCSNIDDVNDILQETYLEVYKSIINNKNINNIEGYIIGIAKNKVKKYYSLLYRIKTIYSKDDLELIDKISDETNIEDIVLNNIGKEHIWNYLKKKKIIIQKIFYLYYGLDLTIKEISKELNVGESYIKNYLYRTLKELQETFRKECD